MRYLVKLNIIAEPNTLLSSTQELLELIKEDEFTLQTAKSLEIFDRVINSNFSSITINEFMITDNLGNKVPHDVEMSSLEDSAKLLDTVIEVCMKALISLKAEVQYHVDAGYDTEASELLYTATVDSRILVAKKSAIL